MPWSLSSLAANRRLQRDFKQLTQGVTLDYAWRSRVALSGSHLFVVGALVLDHEDGVGAMLAPIRLPLGDVAAMTRSRVDEEPALIIEIEPRRPKPVQTPQRILLLFPDQAAQVEVHEALSAPLHRFHRALERREFETLVGGATLYLAWQERIGLDEDWLYALDFQSIPDDGGLPVNLPPTRVPRQRIRALGKAATARRHLLMFELIGPQGRRSQIACEMPDEATLRSVHAELSAHLCRPDPVTPVNAPTPWAALLRTLAAREVDARRFVERLGSLDAEVDTPLWKLRVCAGPEAVFMIDWRGAPDREATFARLFAAWGQAVIFDGLDAADMPDFLLAVRHAAERGGLRLWTLDTDSDFHQGFITPVGLAPQVLSLGAQCGLPIETVPAD